MLFRASAPGQTLAAGGGPYVTHANVQDAHMPGQLDPAQAGIDVPGQAPERVAAASMPSSIRTYRGETPARGAAVEQQGGGSFRAGRRELAQLHDERGAPDPRHVELAPSGLPFGPDSQADESIPSKRFDEQHGQDLGYVVLERPRAGYTSADVPRRPAVTRFLSFVLRPYDQHIARHPGPIDRVYEPGPFAARPRQYALPLAHALPNPSGQGRRSFDAAGTNAGPQPNTVRVLPQPWDEDVINLGGAAVGDPGAAAIQVYARAGWRAT